LQKELVAILDFSFFDEFIVTGCFVHNGHSFI
jgi:hypothetical protein